MKEKTTLRWYLFLSTVIFTSLGWITQSWAQTATVSSTPLVTSQLNQPYGVAGLDAYGHVTAAVTGPIDSATIKGQSLTYIIPQLQKIINGVTGNSNILSTNLINAVDGVLGLDQNGNVAFNFSFVGNTSFAPRLYAALPPTPTTGMVFWCQDCVSQNRLATTTSTGLLVSWNGTAWIDGDGNPVSTPSTTAVGYTVLATAPMDGIASTGSVITDAYALTAAFNVITTSTTNTGVRLANVLPGLEQKIENRSQNPIKVYPPSLSQQVESYGLGVPFVLYPNTSISVYKTTVTESRLF